MSSGGDQRGAVMVLDGGDFWRVRGKDLGVGYVFELADVGVGVVEVSDECTGAGGDC